MTHEILGVRVVRALKPALHRRLGRVTYWVPRGVIYQAIMLGQLTLRGEIRLHFDGGYDLYITWDQGAGWRERFSICASDRSAFLANSLESIDASSSEEWANGLGSELRRVVVAGWEGTPHALLFIFPASSTLVCDGRPGGEFGDADELLVHGGNAVFEQLQEYPSFSIMWDSQSEGMKEEKGTA